MILILFVLGAIVGSFLNVVGTRFNSGLSLGGRSFCPKCGHQLRWYELVPIFSYLMQWGRCRICRARISSQYPLIEILTGLIFATVPYIMIPVFCIYIVILIYDLRHKIIPDILVYFAILLSLASRWFIAGTTLDWLAGPLLFSFFALLWVVTRGRAIGFGDAKLALSVGLLLGASQGFSGIILSFWIGAAYGIFLMLRSEAYPLLSGDKRITMKSEIPFAPFIILGAWLGLIYDLDLLNVSIF